MAPTIKCPGCGSLESPRFNAEVFVLDPPVFMLDPKLRPVLDSRVAPRFANLFPKPSQALNNAELCICLVCSYEGTLEAFGLPEVNNE